MDFRHRVNRILKSATRTFGENVTYFPNVGGAFVIRAIFDNEFKMIDPDTEQLISANEPGIGINLNDFNFPIRTGKDEVEIRGQRFIVRDKQEDGQGGATLLLIRKLTNEPIKETKAY